MTAPSLDLTRLLPPQYRDKTLDTLIRGLFNRHLSKTDVLPLFGHVGDNLNLQPGDVQITENDLERQINQLTPVIYTEHGTEKLLSSWPDLLQKMALFGIDYKTLNDWFTSKSYNFVPPIDLDKFCNFSQYYWIGEWITTEPSLPYYDLGIPDLSFVLPIFASSNATVLPEYYVIERGSLGPGNIPVPPQPGVTNWSDWALTNLWVHRDDLIEFLDTHSGTISFGQLVQATRPLIEYSNKIQINRYQTALGTPSDSGVLVIQQKHRIAQLPLFDLYDYQGTHTGQTSAIFYYQESSDYPIDSQLQRRAVTDANSDFFFEHSLVRADKELLFYNLYDGAEYSLKTIWRQGPYSTINYSKYDSSGTLINQDKFTNFRNYFWVGTDKKPQPIYNLVGLPEYTVVEQGGTSDWSVFNYWIHVSQLKKADLLKYVQATRPIIEFNKQLETEILEVKTALYQLPKFRLYAAPDGCLTNSFEIIPSFEHPNLNDAYTQNHLFARVADLVQTSSTILTCPEVLTTAFEYNGEYYIQGLYTGEFIPERDGVVYGYHARQVEYNGIGDGGLSPITTDTVCNPQILTLTAISSTMFSVVGSVSGILSDLTVGFPFSASGANFKIDSGAVLFEVGDTFIVELRSFVFNLVSVFVNLNGVYRTLTSPSSILTEKQNSVIVPADPTLLNGIWQVPSQIEWNIQNETRTTIGQGDLYYHLLSIIEAQPCLTGGSTGNNNWRTLPSKDLGLGGKIKQYDGNTALLISTLLQQGITPATLIEFARQGYEQLFIAIHTFVNEQIPLMLTNVEFTPPTSGDSIDQLVIDRFKTYFANISPVVVSSETPVDDYISTPFYDSTSSIQNMVVTLPYIGLVTPIAPTKTLDLELNMNTLVHHDGHSSKLPTVATEVLKSIVTKTFVRSPGQQTAGLISGINYPKLPYKGQFWFKASTGELYFYNVISDTGERPITAVIGDYSYNRLLDILSQLDVDGITWVDKPLTEPWNLVKLDLIEANLLLAIEQELFDNCPPLSLRLNDSALQAKPNFDVFQQQEFEKFGITYGVTDVYGTTYVPSNAFTWNYSSIVVSGASSSHAVWQEIYRDIYGTPRPDIQPWLSSGYSDEASFLVAYDIAASNPPGTTTVFDISLWLIPAFAAFVRSLLSTTTKLSVDLTTGALLPPYSLNVEGLITVPPASSASKFVFGDLGPIELYWRKTLNFLYSEQKSYFKLDPLTWLQETWGIKYETAGEYVLNSYLKNKESASDFMLHGETFNDTPQLSWFAITNISYPASDINYSITCVSRLDNIFKVIRSDLSAPVFITSTYSDAYISLDISPAIRGIFWGDGINLTIHSDGLMDQVLVYLKNLRTEGFNQIYSQYSRSYGSDLAISINKSLFSDWNIKLGYRFGGFVNTDTLVIDSTNIPVVGTSFNTYLKENKYYNSSWMDALRVQLVQRGSSERQLGYDVPAMGPGGTPGEDWIFRVDNFNPSHSNISWYQYDLSGGYQDFIALDGKRCLFSWKHYGATTGVTSYNSPFLITGIQNVLNFIFGYSDLRSAEGWGFNDQENPVLDPSTGRPIGYQLLVEQFIAQQFSGATAGSAFLFNPFSRKVWYSTPRGIVTDMFDMLGLEQETVPTLLDSNAKHIEHKNVRVFRQDAITEMVFDRPAYTIHVLTSEFEHVVLFENYSASLLLYDAFLGQKTRDVFLRGEKQTVFSGRMDFGGHFLLGDQMKRNIESSVQGISGLYNTTSTLPTPAEKEQARALLGFQKKQYFEDRGTPDQTEFRFWQGLIANKGTNFSVGAYTNSQRFKNAKLDEFWAYKLAEYGDARALTMAEMKSESEDCTSELTNYLFLEGDELDLIDIYQTDGGYDIPDYDVTPFDSFSLYTDVQASGMEFFDPRGCVIIQPTDEARWFRYFDLKTFEYFTADVIAEWQFIPDSITQCYTVLNSRGLPVRADCFELVDINYIQSNDGYDMLPYDENGFDTSVQERYFEMGDYIAGTNPAEYSPPKFIRINSSTIQIVDPILLGRVFKVIAYGPAISKYSPNILFNFQTNTTVLDDIIWWDPARGSHHPGAYKEVDYEQPKDPARYNVGTLSYLNEQYQTQKPWGENEVGKVWWNNNQMDWQFYADTKIYPDMYERLARWGAPADFSEVQINEWIKSTVSPQDFEKSKESDGELAVKYTLNRTRTWYQRVVAWKYSDNPATVSRKFITYQPSALILSIGSDGYGKAILKEGSLIDANIAIDCKITAANYSSTSSKIDSNLINIFGQANVISEPAVIVGSSSSYDTGASFVPSSSGTLSLTINPSVLSYRTDILGQYQLSNQFDLLTGKRYITLTHIDSKKNQQLEVHDVPITTGTVEEYNFDQLGIIIAYSVTFNRSTLTEATRIKSAAELIGNVLHDIVLRSYVDIFSPIPFVYQLTTHSILDGSSDPTTLGWVAWTDPSSNPGTGPLPPFNKYDPMLGEWIKVDKFLSDVVDSINIRMTEKWTGFEGEDYNPYKSSWGSWKNVLDEVRDQQYCTSATFTNRQFFNTYFTLTGTTLTNKEILARTDVYINNVLIRPDHWTLDVTGTFPVIRVIPTYLNKGDRVRAQIRKYIPSTTDLSFDPSVKDPDPLVLSQWTYDYPHVIEEKRNVLGGLTIKNYFYWVKNKSFPGNENSLGVKHIANLLKTHDGTYSVPQVFKYYNQIDARPNRYGLLSFKNLGRYVRIQDTYKLRLTRNPALRDDDLNLFLKNIHLEWQLLRQYQPLKLPRVLWDLLTNTLCGQTALGEILPFEPLTNYDERHGTTEQFGFLDQQQILTDPAIAQTTLKYTVLNTKVDKYVNGDTVIDYISYPGFNINDLDVYLSSPTNIREFMSNLWRYAKPKQLNEIFFAVLYDAAATNLELTDFFKTSFISLNEIRTIEVSTNFNPTSIVPPAVV